MTATITHTGTPHVRRNGEKPIPGKARHVGPPPFFEVDCANWMSGQTMCLPPPPVHAVLRDTTPLRCAMRRCLAKAVRFGWCDEHWRRNEIAGEPRFCLACSCGNQWVRLVTAPRRALSPTYDVCPACGRRAHEIVRRG